MSCRHLALTSLEENLEQLWRLRRDGGVMDQMKATLIPLARRLHPMQEPAKLQELALLGRLDRLPEEVVRAHLFVRRWSLCTVREVTERRLQNTVRLGIS